MELPKPVCSEEDYLVQRAIRRDREAFSALYDLCVNRVYRHVYYRVANQTETEDITQEIFARAWQAIDRYRQTGAPFTAWLITIANRLIIDYYRSRAKQTKIDEASKNNLDYQVVDPAEKAEVNADNALVKAAVLKLKGDKQKVILMHFIDNFSYAEIARALNKTENAIRVIQYRALADLKRLLRRG